MCIDDAHDLRIPACRPLAEGPQGLIPRQRVDRDTDDVSTHPAPRTRQRVLLRCCAGRHAMRDHLSLHVARFHFYSTHSMVRLGTPPGLRSVTHASNRQASLRILDLRRHVPPVIVVTQSRITIVSRTLEISKASGRAISATGPGLRTRSRERRSGRRA